MSRACMTASGSQHVGPSRASQVVLVKRTSLVAQVDQMSRVPANSLHQLAKFGVGPQAFEGRLASQLDEIWVVFLVGSL